MAARGLCGAAPVSAPGATPSPDSAVSRQAWLIVGLLAAASALNYFDRNIVAVLKPVLKAEFALTDVHYSWLVTAFMAPYVVMYVLAGRLVDRFGARAMLAVFLAGWSLATLLNGLVGGLAGLLVCRFLLGVMEPGGFNACQRAIVDWFPKEKRGRAISLLSPGTALGSILAPPVLAWLGTSLGWRWGFFIPGLLGLGLAALWLACSRRETDLEARQQREEPVPLRAILGSRALWGLLLARVVTDPVWYFYQFWVPGYFQEKLGLSLADYGKVGWIPPAVAMVACLALGWFTDARVGRGGDALRVRRNALIALSLLAPLGLLTTGAGAIWITVMLVSIVLFVGQAWFFFGSLLQTDLFPRRAIGTVNGLIGACGTSFGLALNFLIGNVIEEVGYVPVFVVAGLLHPLAALLVWRMVREPMREPA
jgi:ACS family hexuronate transporter-like MFS transporter